MDKLSSIEKRVLSLLVQGHVIGTSNVGYRVWPQRRMQPQGAALAAGNVLKRLRDRGLVASTEQGDQARHEITSLGQRELAAVAEDDARQLDLFKAVE